jgi:hypothetical protein
MKMVLGAAARIVQVREMCKRLPPMKDHMSFSNFNDATCHRVPVGGSMGILSVKTFLKCLILTVSEALQIYLASCYQSWFEHIQTYLLSPKPSTEPTLKIKTWTGPNLNLRFSLSI